MVKFKTIIPVEIATLLQGRVVCDVVEASPIHPIVGKIKVWRGSTEQEYFLITFMKGVLTLSLVEREMLLGENVINIAMVEQLSIVMERGDSVVFAQETHKYNSNQAIKDVDQISFTDVMVALNWRYAEKAKIDYAV